jgi:hypothetical protein
MDEDSQGIVGWQFMEKNAEPKWTHFSFLQDLATFNAALERKIQGLLK